MKNHSGNVKTFVALLALSLIQSPGAFAATVQISANGPMLQNASVSVTPSGETTTFVGFVGDFLEISDGEYIFTLDADAQEMPHLLTLDFMASVSGQQIHIILSGNRQPKCWFGSGAYGPVAAWPAPTVRPGEGQEDAVTIIDVVDPQYGPPIDLPQCPQAAAAACTTDKVIVTFRSSPTGAEIYVDGELQENRTDVTLSVPFCPEESGKSIVLRVPGAVNCQQRIALAPDAKIPVSCVLNQIH